MGNEVTKTEQVDAKMMENVLLGGNLAELTPTQRLSYYDQVCKSLELNPLTKPFEFITLNNKLTLYARKDCTEQLRSNRQISLKIVNRETVDGVYVVTAQAILPSGRCDESIGAVPIAAVKGEALANCIMKAETKAKRRVTLSICGLGMLDESELETVGAGFAATKPSVQMPQKAQEAPKPAPTPEKPENEAKTATSAKPEATDAVVVEPKKPGIVGEREHKALQTMEKKIGQEKFDALLVKYNCLGIVDVPDLATFEAISKDAWAILHPKKAA